MKGLVITIFRAADGVDCSNHGPSSTATEALVIGAGIPEIFEAHDRPVFRLAMSRSKVVRLTPVNETRWTMFGGNFGYTSDSRFSEAVRTLYGHMHYGAIPIHDRVEG